MIRIDRELYRYLHLLRNKFHDQGLTQLQVQEVLGWGRSYISQLLKRQKSLRFDQLLLILQVLRVEPGEFFAELYGWTLPPPVARDQSPARGTAEQQLEELRLLLDGLIRQLIENEVITGSELTAAVRAREAEESEPN